MNNKEASPEKPISKTVLGTETDIKEQSIQLSPTSLASLTGKPPFYYPIEKEEADPITLIRKYMGDVETHLERIERKITDIGQETSTKPVVTSLERLEQKIDQLRKDVAKRDKMLQDQYKANVELVEKLKNLRTSEKSNAPHKMLAKFAAAFFTFFAFSLLTRMFLETTIITPLWNDVGLLLSFGFLVMAWAMGRDWNLLLEKQKGNDDD
jgi:hypothetical protein